MKKFICLILSLVAIKMSAVTFSYNNISYDVLNESAATCQTTPSSTANQSLSGSISIPATVTYLGKTYKVTKIGDYSFNRANITSVTIGSNVTEIGTGSFMNCFSLATVSVPSSVQTIGEHSFAGCRPMTSFSGPGIKTVPYNAFGGCDNLSTVSLPVVETIGSSAFYACSALTTINVGNYVTSIAEDSFSGCSKLEKITLPSTLRSADFIGRYETLKYVTCNAVTPPTSSNTYTSKISGSMLFVPSGSEYSYKAANGWKRYEYVNPILITSVGFTSSSVEVAVGSNLDLKSLVSYLPSNATITTFNWTSQNSSVASVSNGIVTGLKEGNAVIQLNTTDTSNKSATITVKVIPPAPTGITLDKTKETIKDTQTLQLKATVSPAGVTEAVIWSSSSPSVATVSNTGLVTAVKAGSTTITATCGSVSATCVVTVEPTPLTSVSVAAANNKTTLRDGQTVQLTATTMPSNATTPVSLTWSTSDAAVATVSTEGLVTAGAKVGTATITVKANNSASKEVTGSIQIVVEATPATTVTLNKTTLTLQASQTETLTASVAPSTTTNKTVTWATSDATVATVTDGKVTALKVGTANITATCGNVSATCVVTVEHTPLTSVTVAAANNKTTLRDGETVQLAATIAPSNATEPITVKWSTNKPEVATVDETNGLVTAHTTLGTATITATATNPYGDEVSGTIDIKVIATDASRVILSKYNTTLLTGQSYKLTATIEPESTTDKTVTWSSDKSNIAKVGEDGTVTAVSAGTANITATCGDVTATCVVTVKTLTSDDVTVTPGSGTTEGDDDSSNADNTSEGGSLSGNDLTLRVGQTSAISLLVKTDSDVAPTFEWTLADGSSEVVTMTVNADDTKTATFKGLAIGKTTYTVKLTNTSDAIITGNITVIAENPITSLVLNPAELSMAQNATPIKIAAVFAPEQATVTTLEWSTSDDKVATVSTDGTVTPVGLGKATITAATTDGNNVSATCSVTVTAPIDGNFEFEFDESVTGGKDGITLMLGDTYTFVPKAQDGYVLPDNITWSSDNESVVSVDDNGTVTAKALGEATVTATAQVNGQTVTTDCQVKVIPVPATSIEINVENVTLLVGQSYKLTATIEPENTTYPDVTWASDSDTVATVGEDGTVTAVSAGTANITATCGDVTATCVVTVKTLTSDDVTVTPGSGTTEGDDDSSNADNTSEGGSLNGNDLTLRVGQTSAISLLVKTDSDVAPTFEWTLADGGSEVVTMTVNADDTKTATFKGLAIGKTTYTVKLTNTSDAIITGNITVIAENPVTSLTIEPIEIKIAKNAQPVQLTATATPDDATDATLQWTSSDESIATVDEDGLVTPVSAGECEITAATIDGSNLSATCKVTIIEITGFEFNLADGNTGDDSDVITADGIVLDLHQTVELKVTVEPDVDVAPELTWRIADSSIASLVNGEDCYTAKITGEKIGETTLTVSLTEDPSVSVTTKVIVLDKSGLGNLIFNDANGAPVDVYNMQGVCIVRNATLDDLKALSPGFYIIGGKKVLIK